MLAKKMVERPYEFYRRDQNIKTDLNMVPRFEVKKNGVVIRFGKALIGNYEWNVSAL